MTSIPQTSWIFVNDGSTDETQKTLTEIAKNPNSEVVELTINSGKAEAVRQGLLRALQTKDQTQPPRWVGFIDADTSFSPREIPRFLKLATALEQDQPTVEAIWAARVTLLGRDIQRTAYRHYVGRILATLMNSAVPQLPYDSQAGFKLFKANPKLTQLLSQPFKTRWLFDVELLQRWQATTGSPMTIWEEPLNYWHHTEGSHVSAANSLQVLKEIAFLYGQRPRKG
jgi:glycosyltransferase involved in cell wall biosynthesis